MHLFFEHVLTFTGAGHLYEAMQFLSVLVDNAYRNLLGAVSVHVLLNARMLLEEKTLKVKVERL